LHRNPISRVKGRVLPLPLLISSSSLFLSGSAKAKGREAIPPAFLISHTILFRNSSQSASFIFLMFYINHGFLISFRDIKERKEGIERDGEKIVHEKR
jgi:hypothetical protein